MSLAQQKIGFTAKITEIVGATTLQERLRELGFLSGQTVQIIAPSLLGGPTVVLVGGTTVALRKEELACLKV